MSTDYDLGNIVARTTGFPFREGVVEAHQAAIPLTTRTKLPFRDPYLSGDIVVIGERTMESCAKETVKVLKNNKSKAIDFILRSKNSICKYFKPLRLPQLLPHL